MGKEAPSTMPRHLHLVRDPCTHNRVAHRMANESQAQIQPITDPKGCSHLAHRNSHRRWSKKSVSFPSNPSTDTQIRIKLALWSRQAWEYLCFLSISDVHKTFWGAQEWYDKASVSTTLISKCLGLPNSMDSQISNQCALFIITSLLHNGLMPNRIP